MIIYDNWCQEAMDLIADVPSGVVVALNKPSPIPEDATWVASCTTGTDHLPMEELRRRGIPVIYLDEAWKAKEGRRIYATAEHTWALLMALARKIPWAHASVCQGHWDRERWQGTELHGKTLGVIGYGRVGEQIEWIALAFGMRVIEGPLEQLLPQCDFVTVHVPLNESTKGMFGAKEFGLMKPTAYFINTSRGAVVDEEALHDALISGVIAGAALDVLCDEPQPSDKLPFYAKTHDNLIITPHIAGNTASSRRATQLYIAKKILEVTKCIHK